MLFISCEVPGPQAIRCLPTMADIVGSTFGCGRSLVRSGTASYNPEWLFMRNVVRIHLNKVMHKKTC